VLSVLVVDDEPPILRLMSVVLESEGFDVIATQDSQRALSLLNENTIPDLVVLDLNMPGIDGRSFFRTARQMGFSGPIVICSAYGAEAAQRELGADAAIGKPFDPAELVDVIKEISQRDKNLTP